MIRPPIGLKKNGFNRGWSHNTVKIQRKTEGGFIIEVEIQNKTSKLVCKYVVLIIRWS